MAANVPMLDHGRDGQTNSGPAGPEAIQVTIRHIAASKAVPSDGNKESVAPAPRPPANTTKKPPAPAKRSTSKNPLKKEPQSGYAQESMDSWSRAANDARKMHRGE
jgi:uncharacterized membrane protein